MLRGHNSFCLAASGTPPFVRFARQNAAREALPHRFQRLAHSLRSFGKVQYSTPLLSWAPALFVKNNPGGGTSAGKNPKSNLNPRAAQSVLQATVGVVGESIGTMRVTSWLNRRQAGKIALVLGCALLAAAAVHARQIQPGQTAQPSPPPQPQAAQQQPQAAQPAQQQQPPPPQQQPQQSPPIAVQVSVVNVLASVRDKKGALVSTLGKDDFAIDEDGRTQTITYFARDTDLPLALGLLVDTSESQRRVLSDERDASNAFLDDILRPDKDRAFVIHFDREVELLQDLTNSRDKLQKALDEMNEPEFAQPNQQPSQQPNQYPQGGYPQGGGRGRGGGGGGGTQLYDAIYLASRDVIKKEQGRKALIVLTDGVDHGSKESLVSAIETAQRADTIVYGIYFSGGEQSFQNDNPFGRGGPFGGMGRHGGGGGPGGGGGRFPDDERVDGKKILERISKETGGHLFEVSKKQTIAQIYTAISDELRNQYSLGYTPMPDSGLGYHKIHLITKQKDLTVQTREGYYGER
jgi:VWFA-related protein